MRHLFPEDLVISMTVDERLLVLRSRPAAAQRLVAALSSPACASTQHDAAPVSCRRRAVDAHGPRTMRGDS